MPSLLGRLVVASTVLLSTVPAEAGPSREDYEQLAEHRLGPALPVPVEGVDWSVDASDWTLHSGSIRLQEAVRGTTTGLWFEGRGTLEVRVPDVVELRQLRRFVGDTELSSLSTSFDRMLLRADGGAPLGQLPAVEGGTKLPDYESRHDHYFEIRRFDADAKVLAALADPTSQYWQADVRTPDHGWITVTFDGRRPEELSVERFYKSHNYLESWISLDRAEDRRADGRPTGSPRPLVDILHVDIRADLTAVPRKDPDTIDGRFAVRVDLAVLEDGVSVLPFLLRPLAKVTAVRDANGSPLEFVRDHIGARSGVIDDEIYDGSLLVLLPRAVPRGEMSLTFQYDLRVPKYASGRSWYPMGRDGFSLHDRHTARLELTVDDRHQLQSMGRKLEEHAEEERRTSVWELAKPVKMATFAMQKQSYSKIVQRDGLPRLTTVGDTTSGRGGVSGLGGPGFRVLNPQRIDAVAEGTARAMTYLQEALGPLQDDHLFAAMIPSPHGQAFSGFLHLGNFTAVLDTPATAERFRAHEVGHQWWGHIVGWHSYRDQWLSEGFAEYLALMFVEATVDGGDKVFREAITAYSDEIRGSLGSTFSSFARPGFALLTARGLNRMGPIGHGWRAGTGEAPTAYRTLAYNKGALVLNMIRLVCRQMTGSEDAFAQALRDFVLEYRDAYPSTEEFRAVVERRTGADWSWFFDQWVLGNEIPTYRWNHKSVPSAGGGVTVRLAVEQADVEPGFKMVVPVEIELGKDRTEEFLLWVDDPTEVFELDVTSKPRRVVFNAGNTVIANVKKR